MQFTLQSLLLSFVVIWSSLAAFDTVGLVIGIYFVLIAAFYRNIPTRPKLIGVAFVVLAVAFGLFLGLGLFDPHGGVASGRHPRCKNNLKCLTIAFDEYRRVHGRFPPLHTLDGNGKHWHSWRVLILPYLEEQDLYDRYDFSEPWDGPNNRRLGTARPDMYACPEGSAAAHSRVLTDYVAVVEPKTRSARPPITDEKGVRDAITNRIMLVELADSDIQWTEPRDLPFERALCGIGTRPGQGIPVAHVRDNGYFFQPTPGINVAFDDGSVRFIPADIAPETFEALLTSHSRDSIDLDALDVKRLHWAHCTALFALVVSCALLLFRPRRRSDRTRTEAPRY